MAKDGKATHKTNNSVGVGLSNQVSSLKYHSFISFSNDNDTTQTNQSSADCGTLKAIIFWQAKMTLTPSGCAAFCSLLYGLYLGFGGFPAALSLCLLLLMCYEKQLKLTVLKNIIPKNSHKYCFNLRKHINYLMQVLERET